MGSRGVDSKVNNTDFLGNANLALHTLNWKGSSNLLTAIKCYGEAEKHFQIKNADLHFNRARVFEYLLEAEASAKEYQEANKIDPSLGADKELIRMQETLVSAYKALTYKGRLKAKQVEKNLKSMKTAFKADSLFGSLKLTSAAALTPGFNKGVLLAGKVVQFISRPEEIPS